MTNCNTHSLTMKKKLKKSKTTFNAYNELQYRYGIKLDDNPDILEIQANSKLTNKNLRACEGFLFCGYSPCSLA